MKAASSHLPVAHSEGGPFAPEPEAGAPQHSPISLDEMRALAHVVKDFDLSELEWVRPGGERLRLRRQHGEAAPAHPPAPRPHVEAAPQIERRAAPEPAKDEGTHITSPFVGTFYRSPGPDVPPFVEVGQRVRKGQTLCIIEAMKLMNELEAETDGIIVACLAENGRPVEYGEPLFRIKAA